MNLNWNDVRYFLSVSRTSSFVAASQQLQVTHSTVARRISALEAALDAELFIRTERGCLLTESGQQLLPLAENMERSAMNFQEHSRNVGERLSGKIRIGCPDGLGNCFLAFEFKTLQMQNPLLEVELVSVPIYYSLSKKEVDILITVKRPTAKNIIAENITSYNLGLFASRAYLKSNPPPSHVKDLKEHRLIGYIDDLIYDQELHFLEEIYPQAKTCFRSSTVLAQMNAIKAGIGIGVIPYFMARKEDDLEQVLPDKFVKRNFWAQINPDSSQQARVKEAMNFIIERIRSSSKQFIN
ncbi:LysR family transcriptional regulator [uncultured Pseudodesulfovibrio sp.]|uniref:LysR family transcriptional regulator n=1 Tax=uncultured Pseudodesulfovibrio sp. TaxID=2035858 RepID=UPI0029C7DFE6|nr:LysR family transcriptional regulator [uncultured Pseudodesulfovibrio sp.]